MYESFYKLRKPPFRLTPDPHFFFGSRTHRRGLAYLRYAVQQGEGFVVITGGPGTGKTELMLNLLKDLSHPRIIFAKIVSTNLDADDLLELVAAYFDIPSEGLSKGALLKKLEDFFIVRARQGKQVLLLIDEAHNLSTASLIELSMLSNFQLGEEALLRCFLLGQDLLEQRLEEPSLIHLKQRVIASTHLEPMDESETREYINHRLTQAGWEGDPQFHDNAYPLIHKFTGGVPRQINSFCNRLLLQGFIDEKHDIKVDDVRSMIKELLQETAVSHAPYDFNERSTDSPQNTDAGVHRPSRPRRAAAAKMKVREQRAPAAVPIRVDPAATSAVAVANQALMLQQQELATAVTGDGLHRDTLPVSPQSVEEAHALQELTRNGAGRLLHALSGDNPIDRELRASAAFYVNAELANGSEQILPDSAYRQGGRQAITGELSVPVLSSTIDANNQLSSIWKWATFVVVISLGALIAQQLLFTDNQTSVIEASKTDSSYSVRENQLSVAAADSLSMHDLIDRQQDSDQVRRSSIKPSEPIMPIDRGNAFDSGTGFDTALEEAHSDSEPSSPTEMLSGKDGGELKPSPIATAMAPLAQGQDRAPESSTLQRKVAKTGDDQAHNLDDNSVAVAQAPREEKTVASDQQGMGVSIQEKTSNGDAAEAGLKVQKSTLKARETKLSVVKQSSAMPADEARVSKASSEAAMQAQSQESMSTRTTALAVPSMSSLMPIVSVETMSGRSITTNQNDLQKQDRIQEKPVESAAKVMSAIPAAELDVLLSRLTSAYESGNLRQLVSVFAENAHSNDSTNIDEIEDDYRKLFNVTDMRRMIISGIQWSKVEDQIRGKGNFQLYVREKGAARVASYDGSIRFDVMKSPRGIVITQLDYRYAN